MFLHWYKGCPSETEMMRHMGSTKHYIGILHKQACSLVQFETVEGRTRFLRWNVSAIWQIMYKRVRWPLQSTTKEKNCFYSEPESTFGTDSFSFVFISVNVYEYSLHTIPLPALCSDCTTSLGSVSKSNSFAIGINVHACTLFAISRKHFIVDTVFCALSSCIEPLNMPAFAKFWWSVLCINTQCCLSSFGTTLVDSQGEDYGNFLQIKKKN